MDSIAGSVLGSYRILAELSRGGMGAVFRAEHVLLGRPAAVKLLRPDLTTDADLVQRFVNEARAVTACKHPGIVDVYDFGYTPDGHAYFVMELLEGESLGRRLARGRIAEPEAAAIAQGIASALRAAHRVRVIHRDLKPDNVFLVPDPDAAPDARPDAAPDARPDAGPDARSDAGSRGFARPKVLDFGIAKLGDSAMAPTRRTQTGILMGTPLYMAPEQARAAGTIDPRADLYSLGCIIYHMLVGRPPFVAEGAGEIIALQMFGVAEPPSRLAPVTPEMERLVLRLLEKDPADRFDSAADVISALAVFSPAMTNRPTWPSGRALPVVPEPGDPGGPHRRRSRGADRAGVPHSDDPGDPGDLRATLASRDDLGTASEASLGDVPSERAAIQHARRPGAGRFIAGGVALAALGCLLAYALRKDGDGDGGGGGDGGAGAAQLDPVASPAPGAAPTASMAPAAAPPPTPAKALEPAPAALPEPTIPPEPANHPSSQPASQPLSQPARTTDADARKHRAALSTRPSAKDKPGRSPAEPEVPDRAIEVIRDIRQVDPPKLGAHTSKGSPIETSLDAARNKPSTP